MFKSAFAKVHRLWNPAPQPSKMPKLTVATTIKQKYIDVERLGEQLDSLLGKGTWEVEVS